METRSPPSGYVIILCSSEAEMNGRTCRVLMRISVQQEQKLYFLVRGIVPEPNLFSTDPSQKKLPGTLKSGTGQKIAFAVCHKMLK